MLTGRAEVSSEREIPVDAFSARIEWGGSEPFSTLCTGYAVVHALTTSVEYTGLEPIALSMKPGEVSIGSEASPSTCDWCCLTLHRL